MEHLYPFPRMGTSFLEVLSDDLTRKLLGFDAANAEPVPFITGLTSRLKFLLSDATHQLSFLKIGYTALEAFLQASCTGPPLDFNPAEALFPETYRDGDLKSLRRELFDFLAVDGSRPYSLTPHIELFWLAKVVMSHPTLAEAGFNGRRARFRVNYWHQKLLSEESSSLRESLSSDAEILEQQLASRLVFGGADAEGHFVEFLVERAVMRIHYGEDALARADLAQAARTRHFEFVLSGALGKRTKFQEKDISQLVVLAKSRDHESEESNSRKSSRAEGMDLRHDTTEVRSSTPVPRHTAIPTTTTAGGHHEPTSPLARPPTQPENLLLNDDTLLERIHFKSADSPTSVSIDTMTHVAAPDSKLPEHLASLDPSDQPILNPMDSIILLATASSITNTSPDDGLVREETLPYATRVLDGGSSNWQVYTQALLVRSRIEGYRARTTERGLLQLQALVDQVIAETSQTGPPPLTEPNDTRRTASEPLASGASTFLPRPKPSESASVAERLKYIYQISPPLRWELEAELAQRWTAIGGLKTALDIYDRLQMHAEVALCLAATDEEAKAVALLKSLLFEESSPATQPGEELMRSPPPSDVPRLLCILGDITSRPEYYTLSWKASSLRYARAQRSLGRHLTKERDFQQAAESYRLALNVSRLDRPSWFSLGCIQLELQEWMPAVESFTRCVQLEDQDAESWSNLAVALLRMPKPVAESPSEVPHQETPSEDRAQLAAGITTNSEELPQSSSAERPSDPYRHIHDALRALRRAATLKRDDARIWDNYLTVAASIPPSAGTPWGEIIQAMSRVVELRGKKEGEGCIDLVILKVLTEYVTSKWRYPDASSTKGLEDESAKRADGESAAISVQENGQAPDTTDAVTSPVTNTSKASNGNTSTTAPRLPYTPRSFLSLVDTHIAPLATSSPTLSTLLSTIALWRHRPLSSLTHAEKSWRSFLTATSPSESFDDVAPAAWSAVVDKTIWLMHTYRELGPMERERTGGLVEAKWRFKAKSAGRRVLGRGKTWEENGDGGWGRLKEAVEGIGMG